MPDEETTPQEQPASEIEDMTKIAKAGEEAIKAGEDPAPAMKQARDQTKLELSDDDIDKIASHTIDQLRAAGAFDPPPEPVAPPARPTVPDSPPAAQQPPQQEAPPPQPEPRKKFAHRYMGI